MEVCTDISLEDAPLDEVIDALNSQAKRRDYWSKELDRIAICDLICLFEN